MTQPILNVRPDEYAAIQRLADECNREPEIGAFDDKHWLEGIAELFGATIAMDLVLNCTPKSPARIRVLWKESEWTTPRLQGEGCIFVSSMTGAGPKGKGALQRYIDGQVYTFTK